MSQKIVCILIGKKEYVNTIMDIFFRYQPKVVIATHSPLIVNGSELFVEETRVFKSVSNEFVLQKEKLLNVEELFFKLFDVATPQNRFLSERLVRLLNVLDYDKMTLQDFFDEIERIKLESYDPQQVKALDAVKLLAVEMKSAKQ
jgi:hypothetical protein